jgi:uncharacterized YccA/Bax inhibitor family protein
MGYTHAQYAHTRRIHIHRHMLCPPQIFSGNGAAAMATLGAAKACGVVGMLAVVVSMFKPQLSPYTAPTYALCKGVAMAAMSAVLEMSFPGVCDECCAGVGVGGL